MQLPEQKICELDYIPARITEGKEWFVSFYAFNPAKGKLDRKKIKINRIKSISLRRNMARKLVIKINDQLKRGWNPFIEEEASKAYHKLFDVLDTYTNIIRKEKEENSLRSYLSFLDFLKRYITNELKDKDMYVYRFTDNTASDLMPPLSAKFSDSVTSPDEIPVSRPVIEVPIKVLSAIRDSRLKRRSHRHPPGAPSIILRLAGECYSENKKLFES